MSLRGAKRRGNPHLLRQHKAKRNYSRRIRSHCEFAQSSTCLIGIPAGTRIAAPVCALVRNDRLGRCVRTRGRQQCTTFLPGDADCRTSSPQSPPCPAPAKGQSRATLPCGSSPRKGCPFAGPHALVCNDMQKAGAWLRVQGRFPAVPWYYAGTQQVLACHCEERSDVAIRTPCGGAWRSAVLKANT